jgi:endonuclease/exonuclease/phosphatase (EEP) superfamily protein YafD
VPRWRRWLGFVLLGLVGLLGLLTALPIIETDTWWVRLWDYPRLQIAALIALALIGLVIVWPGNGRTFRIAIGVGIASLAWQLWQVAPYVPGWPKEVAAARHCPPDRSVTMLNANVLLTNRNFEALPKLIAERDPDLVLLLEPGPEWARQLGPVSARFPFRIGAPIPNTYGMILLSKLPLEGAKMRDRLQPHVPSVKAGIRLRSGDVVDFYGLHPEPPYPADDSGERDAELVRVGKEIRAAARAAIVMGDLNDVAWSHTSRLFRRVAGMRDPRVGRGPYPTFPASLPLLAWPLDHIFVTPHFRLVSIDRLPDIGSDHRPMLFGLCLVSSPDRQLNGKAVPAEVREDAKDEIEEGAEERAEENHG